ncbi:TonB-dependent receptor [Aliifodinibius sp. S!AR15-10]|uniref:TonB-dependent receptor plug domain-containing protein n=1 Tax=Aliifodinibius sp. S!AR15-10 TaxID=2950437 RepID=UPI00285C4A32|nr:TonB-dependent receptor [Aliifodinibius sp. S!AR15-10]MDR8392055.1 TonB-dependent receptor [Aliifodinibius sp. S!AR15-10]
MRKLFYLATFSIFCILPGLISAQQIKVVDETNLQPISKVYLFNQDKDETAMTNAGGQVDISGFGPGDFITFQHASYKRITLSYKQIQKLDFLVKLSERSVKMGEVYVSASKWAQDQSQIPQKITQIGTEEISFSNPQTTADLLQSSGKVFVQKSQLGGGSPMIRGFAANSVLIAVDGIRMNNAIFRSGNLQNVISLDANALDRTEVIFGPGSIIYGSDALGGVMNFQTRDPELSFSDQTNVKANSMARYSTANNERTIHGDFNVGFENWGLLTSVTYSNYDDLRSGGDFYNKYPDFGKREEYQARVNGNDRTMNNGDVTLQKHSGYEQLNLMQKVRYRPNKAWNLNYGFHYSTTGNIPRYDRLIERENGDTGSFVNGAWYYGPQIWMMNALELNTAESTKFYDNMSATVAQQWFQESRNDRDYSDTSLRNREENIDVVTANFDFDKRWGEDQELFYGLEGVYNYVSSDANTTNITTGASQPVATRYPDGGSDYSQIAAYSKYRQDLGSKLTAILGARYSHVMLNSRFRSTEFYDFPFDEIAINTGAFSGSLGFTYRPASNLQFNLNGSTGFRAPNVDDAAKVFDSEPGTVIVPNKDLKSEYSYNVDFSIIKRFDQKARIELNSFYTWLRDAMVRRDYQFAGQDSIMYDGELSKVEAVVNAGKAYIYGFSADLTLEVTPYLSLNSNITYTKGKDVTNDEPLRHVAPVFGKSGITYKAESIKVELYTEYNGKKDIKDFSPSERNKPHLYTPDGTPGWATLNAKASYQVNETIRVNAGVENVMDKHYRPYSSGISAPGRNVIVAFRANL